MAAKRSTSSGGKAPGGSDAYVGLLLISLLAQMAGVLFFWLDYSQYQEKKPTMPPALPAAVAPAGGGGLGQPGGNPGVPAGGMGGAVPPAGGAAPVK